MLFTTMKAAYLFGDENTVHLLCTLDDLIRLDLLKNIITERDQIFCVEKYSYKGMVIFILMLLLRVAKNFSEKSNMKTMRTKKKSDFVEIESSLFTNTI